ncbi:hypothetical protein NL453_28455, partial [Klebsiella pneumoniae]|nr:hypothetical protein [Klebsiella pneumoniae]
EVSDAVEADGLEVAKHLFTGDDEEVDDDARACTALWCSLRAALEPCRNEGASVIVQAQSQVLLYSQNAR